MSYKMLSSAHDMYYLNGRIISQFSPDGDEYSDEQMLTILKLAMFT